MLVIGSTGFIGQHLVRALAASGSTVRVMARTPSALPDSVRAAATSVAEGDVRDPAAVAAAVAGCRRVVHLVAGAPEGWKEYERLYIDGTRHVAQACLTHGVEQLQFASSIAALYLGEPGCRCDQCDPGRRPSGRALRLRQGQSALRASAARPARDEGAPGRHRPAGNRRRRRRTARAPRGRPLGLAHAVHRLGHSRPSSAVRARLRCRRGNGQRARARPGWPVERSTSRAMFTCGRPSMSPRLRRSRGAMFACTGAALPGWWALEHVGWTVKAVGRKANNSALVVA